MKTKSLIGIMLVCVTLASVILPAFATDTLLASDFKEESWAKTIDFLDYVRAYALLHGMTVPPDSWHAYMYMTYVNTRGLRVLYAGLSNITFGGGVFFTIPIQTFMMHYKTENTSRDVLMASTFLMLMAFNETEQSTYPDSPDAQDNLWSSFSMGFNFMQWFPNASFPSLSSETSIIPLTYSDDKLRWSWGMRYTNLTAIWWRTYISPTSHTYYSWPMALTTYDELTFNYTLTISPETHKATLTENHVIGRIRDFWHFWRWFITPLYNHYNSTGCYRYGNKISDETVYQFLQTNHIKMSIVDFQTSVMLDRNTYSVSAGGQNVTDNDVLVSNSFISTYADDGEKIFDASFGTKENYNLYNYTIDSSERTFDTYNATARSCEIDGFAQNENLFIFHIGLMRYTPLLVAKMRPRLFEKAKENITNMTRANYFYLIAYPTYSGYRVVHDPTFTVYLTTLTSPAHPYLGPVLIIAAIAAIATLVAVFTHRKKPKQTSMPSQHQTRTRPPTS